METNDVFEVYNNNDVTQKLINLTKPGEDLITGPGELYGVKLSQTHPD